MSRSKLSSKVGLDEKIEILQRAEELYYRNGDTNKQVMLYCGIICSQEKEYYLIN